LSKISAHTACWSERRSFRGFGMGLVGLVMVVVVFGELLSVVNGFSWLSVVNGFASVFTDCVHVVSMVEKCEN